MAFSTKYIVGFAAAVCVVCSIFVAGSAVALKERQDRNAVLDKQKQVLKVAGLLKEDESIADAEVAKRFEANLVPRLVTLETGEYDDTADAATFDQDKAAKDPATSAKAPEGNLAKVQRVPNQALIYQLVDSDKTIKALIIPVEGKGLWSTLKGFIALDVDTTTVQGLTFYSHKETPGLGGEVDNPKWKALWPGRKVFDEEWKPKLTVIKGQAGPAADDPFRVDGLSGATLTSRGVTHLVQFWLGDDAFGPYLKRFRETGE
ncbi:MAG: Na(+)-translocating NADH-quinone reductase subunit C [Nannocystaceae bacterium]|nr:Na(+)-translocating NADH-quinone reductase subunit C [Nannocystaceae bacterium]